jgi:hypothetical protein
MTPSQAYAQKLLDPRWQKKKSHIMIRDNFACQLCGDSETTLSVHHKKYHPSGNPWDVEDEFLITYCNVCHQVVEACKKSDGFTPNRATKSTHKVSTMIIVHATAFVDNCILIFELKSGSKEINFLTLIPEDCVDKIYKLFYEK